MSRGGYMDVQMSRGYMDVQMSRCGYMDVQMSRGYMDVQMSRGSYGCSGVPWQGHLNISLYSTGTRTDEHLSVANGFRAYISFRWVWQTLIWGGRSSIHDIR